jgi:polyisoprenoid-binding protein YceI
MIMTTTTTTTTTTAPPATGTYSIDKAHSEATFQVRHLLTKVRGRFSDFAGIITFDERQPDRSSVAITVQTSSIDTNEPARDAHLRSGDFFAVDEFPTLTFRSTAVAPVSSDRVDVTGELSIRGITKTLTVPVSYLGRATDPWGNVRAAFEGEMVINRKDYGLTWNAALETGGLLVGDEVRISVSIQAIGQ